MTEGPTIFERADDTTMRVQARAMDWQPSQLKRMADFFTWSQANYDFVTPAMLALLVMAAAGFGALVARMAG